MDGYLINYKLYHVANVYISDYKGIQEAVYSYLFPGIQLNVNIYSYI